jgi:cobalt-precorrin-7 (C5)-methyltransferase
MALTLAPIALVGCGPGSADYLTDAARQAVARADVLFGAPRLLALFPDSRAQERVPVDAHVEGLLEQIAAQRQAGRQIAVLLSGDPGLFSLAQRVIGHFGRDQCHVIPAISSVQVAFARLALDWLDARILSAHGRTPEVTADQLCPLDKIAILAGVPTALRWSGVMAQALGATHAAFLAENLTLPEERLRELTPAQLQTTEASSLSIVLLIRRSLLP